jgi:hypothetical protein
MNQYTIPFLTAEAVSILFSAISDVKYSKDFLLFHHQQLLNSYNKDKGFPFRSA